MAIARRKYLGRLHRGWKSAWAWALRRWWGRGARRERHRAQATDMESLARRLHELERQLGRARVHYASEQLSRQQLEQLYWRIVDEVHAQLRPLLQDDAPCRASWATQRLQQVLNHWHERSPPTGEQPLHQADVSDLQAQLLELTTALYVCARVEDVDRNW